MNVFINFRKKIWNLLIEYNLYIDDDHENTTISTNNKRVRMQIWSTRLFLITFMVSFIILIMFASIPKQLVTITIEDPSVEIYNDLELQYGDQLQCPCSQLNTPLEKYVNVTVTFHQICSSDFVSDQWIEESYDANVSYIWPMDTRTIISAHGQFLQSLCSLSQSLVNDSLISLGSTSILNAKMISSTVLTSEVNTYLNQLQSSLAASLNLQLNIIRHTNDGNQLMSGLGTNTMAYVPLTGIFPYQTIYLMTYYYNLITSYSTQCSCSEGGTCNVPSGIYMTQQSAPHMAEIGLLFNRLIVEDNSSTVIPEIRASCLPFEGFLASTLECYYNPFCLQMFTSSNIQIQPLDPTQNTRFDIYSTTMESLIQSLFIEEFSNTIDHRLFFSTCAPRTCSYTIMQHNNFVTIMVLTLTLIGGLNAILKFLCPLLVRMFIGLKNKKKGRSKSPIQAITEDSSRLSKKRVLFNNLKAKALTLNIFKSHSRTPRVIKRQRWSTRVYLLALFLTMVVLSFYTVLRKSSIKITVDQPSEDEYKILYSMYNDSLACSCRDIVMDYIDIIQLDIRYHQICSSDFVSPNFYFQLGTLVGTISYGDFIAGASSYFSLLESICDLVQTTINNSYTQYLSIEYVYQNLLPPDVFINQINSSINTFISNTREEFYRTLFLTREVTSANQLINRFISNCYIYLDSYYAVRIRSSLNFGSLSYCGSSRDLSTSVGFFNTTSGTIVWLIPGLRTGCFPIESLLQSTFECFYDVICLQTFNYYVAQRISRRLNPPSLLDESETRFPINATFNDILNELIVEEWIRTINYSVFYSKCSPVSCTYTITEREDIITVSKTVIGILGGLNRFLYVFVPLVMTTLFFIYSIFQNQQQANSDVMRESYSAKLRRHLVSLNFFPKVRNTNEDCQRKGTRIYILILFIVIISLALYKIFDQSTSQVIIANPSFDTYTKFYNSKRNNSFADFQCSCSTVSLSYADIGLTVNGSIHEICSSWIISASWMGTVGDPYEYERYFSPNGRWNDSKQYGQAFFRNILSLCSISEEIVSSYWQEYLTQQFISSILLTEDQFHIEMNQTVNQGQQKLTSYLENSMKLIRSIIQGNQYISAFRTNWLFYIRPDYAKPNYPLAQQPLLHGTNCSCSTSMKCIEQIFYINPISNATFYVPGMFIGCLPIDGLMESTFECFYSQSCVDNLVLMYKNPYYTIPWLGSLDQPSKYQPTTTVKEIFRNLFLEEITMNVSYMNYFNACAPSFCSYLETNSFTWIDILISLLGIYGGLVIVLRLLIPYLIKILYAITQRKLRRRVRQAKTFPLIIVEPVSSM